MAKKKKNREVNVFGVSFLDVLSNTVGGLSFLLIIVFLMMGQRQREPVEIMTGKTPDAYTGEQYDLALAARGGGGVYKWRVSKDKLPEGLKLDAANGLISGKVADKQFSSAKTVNFTVECEGRTKKVSEKKLKMTIQPAKNRMISAMPVKIICKDQLPQAIEENAYPLALACEGGLPPYKWSIASGKLPPGMSLSPSGHISGTAKNGGSGEYKFEIAVVSGPWQAKKQVSMKVKEQIVPPDPVKIVCDNVLPQAMETERYPLVLACRGGVAPYKWRLSDGKLPEGLTIDQDGKISGTPKKGARGKYSFEVRVECGLKTVSRKTVGMTVVEKIEPSELPPPLKVLTDTLPDAVANRKYRFFPAAEGGVPPYRWSIVSKHPAWLQNDNSNKSFSGKPGYDEIASHMLTFEVKDSASPKAAAARVKLELNIIPPGRIAELLKLLTKTLPELRAKNDFSFSFTAKDGYPPYRWSCKGVENFKGLTFDRKNGTLHGIPAEPGSGKLKVAVLDAADKQAATDFDLKIIAPFVPLGVHYIPPPIALAELKYSMGLSAYGGYPPYKWSVVQGNLPEGLKLEAETGRITGIPTKPGDYSFNARVTDMHGVNKKFDKPLLIKVLSRKQRPKLMIATKNIPLMVEYRPFELSLACEGGLPPYKWQITGNLPPGLSLKQDRLTGTPETSGSYPITVSVLDAEGQQAKVNMQANVKRLWPWWWILIAAAVALICLFMLIFKRRSKPRITTIRIPNARASCEYYVKLSCEGGTLPYEWGIVDGELPPGLELSKDGVISGMPFEGQKVNKPTEAHFTVEVRDARRKTDRREL